MGFHLITESESFIKISNGRINWKCEESFSNTIGIQEIGKHAIELQDSVSSKLWSDYRFQFRRIALSSTFSELGLRKTIIFASGGGNVVAVDSMTGYVKWQTYLGMNCLQLQKLERKQAVVVICKDKKKVNIAVSLNAFTGRLVESLKNDIMISNMPNDKLLVSTKPSDFEKLNLLATILSPSPAVNSVSNQRFWYCDAFTGTITGYHQQSTGTLTSSWTVKLPRTEKIQSITKADIGQVASLGRILGNRTVLFKYLNPNYIVVTTKCNRDTTMYMIDTISGSILEREICEGCSHLMLLANENFLAFCYERQLPVSLSTGVVMLHQEISIVEVYESSIPNQRYEGEWFNSFSTKAAPSLISKSFVLPFKPTAIGVTKTRAGITKKEFIRR